MFRRAATVLSAATARRWAAVSGPSPRLEHPKVMVGASQRRGYHTNIPEMENELAADLHLYESPSLPPSNKHFFAALVSNEPGVLASIAGMFAARGFNIDSLVVGRTEAPGLSRMTIVAIGDESTMNKLEAQLDDNVSVWKVTRFKPNTFIQADSILVKVGARAAREGGGATRQELLEMASLFRGRVVDVNTEDLIIQLTGAPAKLEAFLNIARSYGIVEMARTGVIAMARTWVPVDEDKLPTTTSTVDATELPPG